MFLIKENGTMKCPSIVRFFVVLSFAFIAWQCKLLVGEPDHSDNGEQMYSYTKLSTINQATGVYTTVKQDAYILYPQFALNGNYVVYREDHHYEVVDGTPRDITKPALKLAKADGTKDTILINGQIQGMPVISVDGTKAAVMINNISGSGFTLSVVDLNTRIVTQVKSFTSNSKAGMPCFTSDGLKVVYADTSGPSTLVAVTIASGSEQTIFSSDSVVYLYPKPIPMKGKLLYHESLRYAPGSRLYIMNDDGSDIVYLDSLRARIPSILPIVWTSGDIICYNASKDNGFAFINIDGTGRQLFSYSQYDYSINDFMATSQEILVQSMGGYLGIFNRSTGSYTQLSYFSGTVAKYFSATNMFLVDTSYSKTIYLN
jgi:hypothetical protein